MPHLMKIKHRINSIKTTKKITLAMRLISMSLYSRLDEHKLDIENHKKALFSLFNQLLPYCSGWKNNILFPLDLLDETPLIILISPTKGLCGGLNANLNRYEDRALFIEEHQKPTFIAIGQRAVDYITEHNLGPILYSHTDLNSHTFDAISEKIAQIILEKDGLPYSSITCYSAHLKNFFVQIPKKVQLIPLEANQQTIATQEKPLPEEPIWEQTPQEIIDYTATTYLERSIANLLFQALLSEQAARFVAMDSATTNAEKYLEKLTLQFNKTRQGLITREVAELSASL